MSSEYEKQYFTSVQMEEILKNVFGPTLQELGFLYCGKCRWFRQAENEIKHVFYLYPHRPGSDYWPFGGISLDFVPRIKAGKVVVDKHPRLMSHHLSSGDDERCGIDQKWWITRKRSDAEGVARRIASVSLPVLDGWLTGFSALADVQRGIVSLKSNKRTCALFYGLPETVLALAFLLKKSGDEDGAKYELEKALESQYYHPESHVVIRALWSQLESQSR